MSYEQLSSLYCQPALLNCCQSEQVEQALWKKNNLPMQPAGKTIGKRAKAMGKSRAMGALTGLVRVPPGCSRSASSMRNASKAQAEKVAVVATCIPHVVDVLQSQYPLQ